MPQRKVMVLENLWNQADKDIHAISQLMSNTLICVDRLRRARGAENRLQMQQSRSYSHRITPVPDN